MITAWILYAVLVGALMGGGGLALEKLLRTHGRPSRWIWTGAMILSVGWPLGHWAWENRPVAPPEVSLTPSSPMVPPVLSGAAVPLEPLILEVPPESVLRLLDGPVLVVWALATGLLLLSFTFLVVRTRRLRTRWRRGRAGGRAVLFSEEWGPAVVGFLRPQIVLPAWCGDVDEMALRFILDHELEHVRAGDLRHLILAAALPVFFPWHLPVWWQLARLRTAVEGDCDLRVLGKNPGQTRPYVDLLLELGRRPSAGRLGATMLTEPYETLKRRIRIMTMPLPKRPWLRGGLLAGFGGILVALACWAPGPVNVPGQGDAPPVDAVSGEDVAFGEMVSPDAAGTPLPVFTPFSVRPRIRNRADVMEALAALYPPELKDAGIGGTVEVWFFSDEEGRVQRTLVNVSSGQRALDDAAIRVAGLIEFTPALNRDQPRPVWISLPLVFAAGQDDQQPPLGASPEDPASGGRAGADVIRSMPGEAGSQVRGAAFPPGASTVVPEETGEIGGTVTDGRSGEALAFVQVFVPGTGRGTLSNRDGRFLIHHVPVGTREVVAELIGYGQVGQAVTVAADQRIEVDLGPQVTAIRLDPLVVRGSGGAT